MQKDAKIYVAGHRGLVGSAIMRRLDVRRLRSQMVHEYIEDPVVLASALDAGHAFVPELAAAAARLGA